MGPHANDTTVPDAQVTTDVTPFDLFLEFGGQTCNSRLATAVDIARPARRLKLRRAGALLRPFPFLAAFRWSRSRSVTFRMFETLNDRGLKAGAADILKNYFFSKADARLIEAQTYWGAITSSIESLSEDEDERLVTFLRHFWVIRNGPTKERELAKAIRTEITGETKTLTFLAAASTAVEAYVALWSSKHTFWTRHRASTRHSVDTIANHLRVEQIRPLMFAVALEFDPVEAEKAFRLFVSWSVRFLIYGGRGGMLDEQYSRRAQEVGTGRITKARELRDAMERYVPSDAEFEAAFATARVSRAHLAR